jgi:copper(I)-binding protein
MPAQVRGEVNLGHATKLAGLRPLTTACKTTNAKDMKRRTVLLLPLFATQAWGHSAKVGNVKIGHAWAAPGVAGQDGHCFMPLLNVGTTPDALVAARSPACSFIQLRRNARYDMPAEQQFELLPNTPVAMRPHATHLQLAGLNQNLVVGENFKLVLDFLNAGEIEVTVDIELTPGD